MKEPPANFNAVPTDESGRPMSAAYDEHTYEIYLKWLADYLYRPESVMPTSAILSLEDAWSKVSQIESEIAFYIWEHPWSDYPPSDEENESAPSHGDYFHRPELSKILSLVPGHADRRELLHRFYQELSTDAAK